MIAAIGPHRPSLPALVNPGNTNRATPSSQFAPTDLAISPMSSAKYGLFTRSLSLFAKPIPCFHQLTDSFRENRGVGGMHGQNSNHILIISTKKGKNHGLPGGRQSGAWGITTRTGP